MYARPWSTYIQVVHIGHQSYISSSLPFLLTSGLADDATFKTIQRSDGRGVEGISCLERGEDFDILEHRGLLELAAAGGKGMRVSHLPDINTNLDDKPTHKTIDGRDSAVTIPRLWDPWGRQSCADISMRHRKSKQNVVFGADGRGVRCLGYYVCTRALHSTGETGARTSPWPYCAPVCRR